MKTQRTIFTALALALAFTAPLRADQALDDFKKETQDARVAEILSRWLSIASSMTTLDVETRGGERSGSVKDHNLKEKNSENVRLKTCYSEGEWAQRPLRVRLDCFSEGNGKEQLVDDGDTCMWVIEKSKSYLKGSYNGVFGARLRQNTRRWPWIYFLTQRNGASLWQKVADIHTASSTMAGEEVINGVLCDLVYNKDSGETTAFSRADGLPRRLESRAIKGWRYYMDILSIKVNGALDERTFSITPPEGYVQKTPEQLDAP